MFQRCPLCKVNRMIFGGMVAKEGTICGKCYDKLIFKRKLNNYTYKHLCMEELSLLLASTTDEEDINAAAEKILNNHDELKKKFSPLAQSFRSNYANLFNARGIKQNAAIQDNVTQFLWHKLILKKKRLDAKNIILKSEINQATVPGKETIIGTEVFDGKYEVGIMREIVQGTERYFEDEKQLFESKNFSVMRFRTLRAHNAGKNKIICPSCGAASTRSNLLDGCDYCGTKFHIEDLDLRISDFALDKNLLISAEDYFHKDTATPVGKNIAFVSFILMLPVCFVNIASFLPMLFGCAVLAAIFGVIGSIFYDMLIKPLKWVSMDKKGVKQLYGRTVAEEQRKNTSILEKIHEFDPLFSYEGFYSEIENILSAVHYAEDPVQVQAFWNNADRAQIKEILNEYTDVIDMQVTSVSVQNYEVADGFQRISLRLLCRLLCKNASSVIEKMEMVEVQFVKNEACKTHAVCAPSFLTCSSCGDTLSLMEGAYCHSCGQAKRLADIGWAIEKYKIERA